MFRNINHLRRSWILFQEFTHIQKYAKRDPFAVKALKTFDSFIITPEIKDSRI